MKSSQMAATILAAALALTASACGGRPADPVQAAREKLKAADSMDACVVMDMAFRLSEPEEGQFDIAERLTLDTTSFTDPFRLKVEAEVALGYAAEGLDEQIPPTTMTMYAEGKGDSYTMYLSDGTGWKRQSASREDLAPYDAKGSLALYLDSGAHFVAAGEEKLDGCATVKYEGVIRSEALEKVLRASGALGALDALNASGGEAKGERRCENLPELTCALWLDAESGYPVKYEMDMTALMHQVMNGVTEAAEAAAGGVAVDRMVHTVTCGHFNAADKFQIPAGAEGCGN